MKYLRAVFKGYIGFYNGMGLEIVDIDFTKCQHNMILIVGKNGSGKSTLMNSLNLFPDPSSSFIPDHDAEKHLVLSEENDIYDIRIFSASDLKGGRKTTKAYIKKNGMELNENGNVSTYKDIIFSEFELDSNYISLSKLSGNDRGLGDKTPAERKRFASNIIDNLEIYNSMYKSLNKKALIYKSHINTIHTKIQNIGMKEQLEATLSSLKSKESTLNRMITEKNNRIIAIQAKNSIDPEEEERVRILTEQLDKATREYEALETQISMYENKTKINRELISKKYSETCNLLTDYRSKYQSNTEKLIEESNRLKSVNDSIHSLEAELDLGEYDSGISDRYAKSNETLKSIISDIKKLGFDPDCNQIYEITSLLDFLHKFITMLDKFYDGLTTTDSDFIVNKMSSEYISEIQNNQNSIMMTISNNNILIKEVQDKLKTVSILENRPKQCKVDSCPFISDAVKIRKSSDEEELLLKLDKLQEENLKLSDTITELQKNIDYYNSMLSRSMQLGAIRELVSSNVAILSKFHSDFLDNYLSKIANLYSFNFERDPRKFIELLNLLKILEAEQNQNKLLEVEYKGYSDKIKLINSSNSMLEKLKAEEKELLEKVSKTRVTINGFKSMIETLEPKANTQQEYSVLYTDFKTKEDEYLRIKDKVDEYKKKSSKSIEALGEIQGLQVDISNLTNEITPVLNDISNINGQLTMLNSYYSEYNEYKQSYDIIETLKKYCSPTGGGIQTLFMQLYMSKTLEISNQVLSMLFGGEYQLMDFIINESEFRIPFIGSGLPVDDISSGSASQIAMMGMIINLVLLHQASTKFNIARLDEIDGMLDQHNRMEFVQALYACMNILNINQLFIISHSLSEIDSSSADVIKLKSFDELEDSVTNANIIFDYKNAISNIDGF